MDIFISNTYSARPLSLNRKKGTTRDSFQWEISAGNKSYILTGNFKFTSVKLEVGVSGFMDILISNMYSARPLSLNRKEGTTRDSFQQEITRLGMLNLTSSFHMHTL